MSAPASRPGPDEKAPRWFVPVGVLIGFAGALCGIGGGIFAGPLLHTANRLPLRRAAPTAILVILGTTTASTVAEFLRGDSQLAWRVALPLALGALLGSGLGFRLSKRIDERSLKALFTAVLILAGLRVLLFTQGLVGAELLDSRVALLLSFCIGLVGGSLTPLLGIAGGVVMVPALFLSMHELGFGGARACALAAGAVAALRSLWLHARAGNISYPLGIPLAIGALLGALAGVEAAHHEDFAFFGRILLGLILLAQGARFARELVGTK